MNSDGTVNMFTTLTPLCELSTIMVLSIHSTFRLVFKNVKKNLCDKRLTHNKKEKVLGVKVI